MYPAGTQSRLDAGTMSEWGQEEGGGCYGEGLSGQGGFKRECRAVRFERKQPRN